MRGDLGRSGKLDNICLLQKRYMYMYKRDCYVNEINGEEHIQKETAGLNYLCPTNQRFETSFRLTFSMVSRRKRRFAERFQWLRVENVVSLKVFNGFASETSFRFTFSMVSRRKRRFA